MKKALISYLIMSVVSLVAYAEFSISGVQYVGVSSQLDTLFVVQSVDGGILQYTADDDEQHNFVWNTYDSEGNISELVTQYDTNASVTLEDAASQGYMLSIDDAENLYLWVFDKSSYAVSFDDIEVVDSSDFCNSVTVKAQINTDTMRYYSYTEAAKYDLERTYKLCFDTVYFSTDTYVYDYTELEVDGSGEYELDAPLDDTTYTLTGDNFDLEFGTADSIATDVYEVRAVELHALAAVNIREDAENELDRGEPTEGSETVENIEGSAPLNIEILNYSSPAATRDGYTEWCVSTDKEFESYMFTVRSTDFRYTFEEQGTYYIRLQVSNGASSDDDEENCMQEKTYQIDVLASSLDVPNVFTPNGDGINDEFRVAYRSLISFHGVIYNIWGRKVFEWTDPATGWDGTINGRPAAAGVYYYVIEAVGDDYDSDGNRVTYAIRGDLNLLR